MLPGISQGLLNQQFNVNDVGLTPDLAGLGGVDYTHVIKWGTGCSAGTIEIEGAHEPDYTGKWFPLATVSFNAALGPAPYADYVRTQGAYNVFRHRISAMVLDGTVSTKITGSV